MIISHKYKFIMFLPWKCGSATCEKRFAEYNESPYPSGNHYSEILNKKSNKHIQLSDFQKLPESKLDYYKISWARNPYDRLYSGFLQLKRVDCIKWKRITCEHIENWNSWFEHQMITRVSQNVHLLFPPENSNSTHLSDKQYVDFIGRIETMNSDTKKICKHLGFNVDLNKTANIKTKFKEVDPFDMKISDYKYIDKYTDEQIKIVNQVYAKDFELFKYKTIQ